MSSHLIRLEQQTTLLNYDQLDFHRIEIKCLAALIEWAAFKKQQDDERRSEQQEGKRRQQNANHRKPTKGEYHNYNMNGRAVTPVTNDGF